MNWEWSFGLRAIGGFHDNPLSIGPAGVDADIRNGGIMDDWRLIGGVSQSLKGYFLIALLTNDSLIVVDVWRSLIFHKHWSFLVNKLRGSFLIDDLRLTFLGRNNK